MKMTFRHSITIGALLLMSALLAPADAAIVGVIFDSSITGSANAAAIMSTINSVVGSYETLLVNPVHITVTFQNMASGLGQSSYTPVTTTYSTFRTQLTANATTASDTTALASLPNQVNNPVDGTPNMSLTVANAQALGISRLNSPPNATISLNFALISSSNYDMSAVLSHELDEVLGIGGSGTGLSSGAAGQIGNMDLFRYSANGVRSYTNSTSATSYFSINGGATNLVNFNQTGVGDYGDWGNPGGTQSGNSPAQVQDAFGTPGAIVKLGVNEKTAFDVVGYTLLVNSTWNSTGSAGGPVDGGGTWNNASGSTWWNGTTNSTWSAAVQNAQFGTPGTASGTAYAVTLGSAITVNTLTFANQNYTISGGGNSLTVNNGIRALANATVNAPVILGGANTWEVGYTTGTTIATLTVGGNISGAGFGLTKQGPGTLVLSGSNSYNGGTTVANGILQLNSAGALPTSGNVIVSGGSLDIHGQAPSIGNLTFGDGVSVTPASVVNSGAAADVTLNGDITYTGTFNGGFTYYPAATISANVQLAVGTHHITSANATLANTYDIVISGAMSGPGGITKDGAFTRTALTGVNTYSGATVINAGRFYGAATNALSPNSAVTVNSPGVLDLSPLTSQTGVTIGSYNQVIGSLTGGGNVQLGSATLTVGNDGTTTTYSGSIFSNPGALTKTGAGTLILTNDQFYTGTTTINNGTLQLGNGTTDGFIDSSSGVTGLSTGTLALNLTANWGIAVPIGGAVNVLQAGPNGIANFLTGNNTYSGTTTINAGTTIVVGSGTNGSLGTGNTINNGSLQFQRTNTLVVSSSISGPGTLTVASGGTIVLTGTNTYLGTTTVSGAGTTLQIGNGGIVGSLSSSTTITGIAGRNLAFNRSDAFTVGSTLSGALTVAQIGTGTTTLSATSGSFTGPVNVNAGTLLVTGSISGSSLTTVNNAATLGGTGTTGAVNALSGGTILPGSATAPGLLNTKNFSLASGAHLSLALGGTTGTGTSGTSYGEVKVTGSVTLGGDAQISLFGAFTPALNDTFFVILNDGSDAVSGSFSNASTTLITVGSYLFQVNYAANGDGGATPNDVSLKVVPEPGACVLLAAGAAFLIPCRRRRR
jgi:autotransporter-associated beta strand protein